MPHLIPSHKSEEVFLNKSLAVDAARVSKRTSSVQVKTRYQASRSKTERFKPKAGDRLLQVEKRQPQQIAAPVEKPSHSQSGTPKLPALFNAFSLRTIEHLDRPRIPSRRPIRSLKGSTKKYNISHTPELARQPDGAQKLCGTLPTPKSGQQLQRKLGRNESSITNTEDDVWYECEQNNSQRKAEEEEEVEAVAKQEYQVRIWWETVRLALQVDVDLSNKYLPAPGTQSCSKSWKNSGSNFFPLRFGHLQQNEIIEAVLDKKRRFQQPKEVSPLQESDRGINAAF